MNVARVSGEWYRQVKAERDRQLAEARRREAERAELSARAVSWVRRALPSLVDHQGHVCSYAVAAVLELHRAGVKPTRDAVLEARVRRMPAGVRAYWRDVESGRMSA